MLMVPVTIGNEVAEQISMQFVILLLVLTFCTLFIITEMANALAQLQSMPLQDPRRLNQNKDAITQAAINFENAMLSVGIGT